MRSTASASGCGPPSQRSPPQRPARPAIFGGRTAPGAVIARSAGMSTRVCRSAKSNAQKPSAVSAANTATPAPTPIQRSVERTSVVSRRRSYHRLDPGAPPRHTAGLNKGDGEDSDGPGEAEAIRGRMLDRRDRPDPGRVHPDSEQIAVLRSRLGGAWPYGQGRGAVREVGAQEDRGPRGRNPRGRAAAPAHARDPDRGA